jgi:hypothetical protein
MSICRIGSLEITIGIREIDTDEDQNMKLIFWKPPRKNMEEKNKKYWN